MIKRHPLPLLPLFFLLSVGLQCLVACNNTQEQQKPPEVVVVKQPEKIDEKVKELVESTVQYISENKGKLNDSVEVLHPEWLASVYGNNGFSPLWSSEEKWNLQADSMYAMVADAKLYGLFPSDYYLNSLSNIRSGMNADSLHRKNAASWARADVLFTAAYLNMAHDLSLGRLNRDSVTLRSDSLQTDTFFIKRFSEAYTSKNIRSSLEALEPKLRGYQALKAAIPSFLDSANFTQATYVMYPNKDSAALMKQVAKRLDELGFAPGADDTTALRGAIRKYQKQHGIPVTGKIGEKTVSSLNMTDWQRFKRIAVNLDRYKLLTDTLPKQYIWVNLPGFYLQLWDADTLALESKVVVGKPQTRTPLLTSKVTDMVTYPQWTIPTSIIVKEVLPGLQRDTNYLRRKGYSLIDDKGDEVYPSTVKWSRYSKGIPYKVVQGSGDDNALGVLKFNFNNKYSVYMHDTNQRYFFSRAFRALSHGCVRVQQWQKLAHFIISNDSLNAAPRTNTFKTDSLTAWLFRKEKHVIPVRTRIPVYLRYFGCVGEDGKMKFFEDIYNEDRMLSERYFANKPVN